VQPAPLPSGVVIPVGYTVAIYLKAIHHNPDLYPNPQVFDPFRFSRLREAVPDEGVHAKWAFSTADRNVSAVLSDIGERLI
jgi:cytochrome P450